MILYEKKFKKIAYLIQFPNNYSVEEKYPVIFFMHGAGSRGNDLNKLKTNPYFLQMENHKDFPFITVAPLCNENTWFDMFEQIKEFLIFIYNSDFCDKHRLYSMGASMGGYGVWQLAMSLPDIFAAIVPICGGGMYWNASRLKNVPIWAFHGEKDCTVFSDESKKIVDKVNLNDGNAKLTIYPNNSHDAWSDTYKNWEVFEWLLANTNKNEKKLTDVFTNSLIYG